MGFRRSEYGRQYREPAWDTYQDYYRQQVSYRAYRRQLEHHHNFVEWDWETESETGADGRKEGADRPEQVQAAGSMPEDHWNRHVNEGEAIAARGVADREVQTPDWGSGKNSNKRRRSGSSRDISKRERQVPETTPRPKTSLERVRGGGGAEGTRPPLLAFGWADSKKDMGCKKTFNVRASAHGDNTQVFPAALRAMRRNQYAIEYREEQKRRENLKMRRLRAAFNIPPPDDTAWTTEYQRNYTAQPQTTRRSARR
ncbi:centriole, cilia and spindle-associated protein-like [Lytechinus pictus]|uniref:centriole, cilia and spindle-associated protein-like n=1 Tax=Lytechinus pictus TaxID=7653 RepID=UPI0030B9BE9A